MLGDRWERRFLHLSPAGSILLGSHSGPQVSSFITVRYVISLNTSEKCRKVPEGTLNSISASRLPGRSCTDLWGSPCILKGEFLCYHLVARMLLPHLAPWKICLYRFTTSCFPNWSRTQDIIIKFRFNLNGNFWHVIRTIIANIKNRTKWNSYKMKYIWGLYVSTISMLIDLSNCLLNEWLFFSLSLFPSWSLDSVAWMIYYPNS